MPITIIEQESGQGFEIGGDNEAAEKLYRVWGDYTETAIYAVLDAIAPTTYTSPATGRTLYRERFSMKVGEGGVWDVSVPYGPRAPKEVGDPPEFSFDVSTDNSKLTYSRQTINTYPAGEPSRNNAINWNVNTKEAEGVDILTPKCVLRYKGIVADGTMTDTYKRTLSKLVGKTNDGIWKGYAADEALLIGISGSFRFESQDWDISCAVAISESVTGLTIGAITGIAKPGWAYLWVEYAESLVASVKTTKARAVRIERVYQQGNFADLPF